MDTLKASRTLREAGMDQKQADAVAQVINDLGRDGLVTKEYLDARLAQLAVTHAATTFALLGLFKFFS